MRPIVRALMLIYYPVIFLLVVLDTAVLGVVVIAASFFDPNGNAVHHIGRFWSRINLFFSGVSVRLSGLENIRPGKPYIVMSNHQSHYELDAVRSKFRSGSSVVFFPEGTRSPDGSLLAHVKIS